MRTQTSLRILATASLLGLSSFAHAQVFDDVDIRREGNNAIFQIKFTTAVQYIRAVNAKSGDLVQVFYDIVPGQELPRLQTGESRIAGGHGLVTVTLTDEQVRTERNRKFVARFDTPSKYRVRGGPGNRSIEIVVEGAGPSVDNMTAALASERYVVNLLRSNEAVLGLTQPIPAEMQDYQVFTARRVVNDKTVYEVNLGYFSTRADAEHAVQVLKRRFPGAEVVDLKPTPQVVAAPTPTVSAPVAVPVPVTPVVPGVPAVAGVPAASGAPTTPGAPAAAAATPPATPPAASATPESVAAAAEGVQTTPTQAGDIDAQGRALLAQGRAELEKSDFEAAIGHFNQLLNLPPNVASQDGQEMAGVARARLGDYKRARAEFELYLKLYPTGPGAERVKSELDKLNAVASSSGGRRPRGPITPTTTINGSVSQYYYGGRSNITTLLKDTPLEGAPTVISQDTLTNVDQSQLVNNVDFNYRHRDADQDMRFVFRDSYTANFLSDGRSRNRLSALYFDYRQTGTGLSAKIGRQSPTGGGVLGKFDGAQIGYAFVPKWRVNAVAGVPADDFFDSKRRFYGMSVETEGIADRLSGSVYGIQQTIDGEVDRRAVGGDLRYFDPHRSLYTLVDYDTIFKAVNIATMQGSWTTYGDATVNLLLDRRTTPALTTGNAMLETNYRTIKDMLAFQSLDTVRQLAQAKTAYANQGLLGVTVPVIENLQLGLDARLTKIDALPSYNDGTVDIPARPGTGNIMSYSLQAIATNLYSSRDAHIFNFTYVSAPDFDGKLASYNNLSVLYQNWQLEPSLKFYTQSDTNGTRTDRWTPELRLSYRMGQRLSLESDFSVERSKTEGLTQSDTTTRAFFYVGYRYDY